MLPRRGSTRLSTSRRTQLYVVDRTLNVCQSVVGVRRFSCSKLTDQRVTTLLPARGPTVRARGAEAPALDEEVLEFGVLDERAHAVLDAARTRREQHVREAEAAGLVEPGSGLQDPRVPEQLVLAVGDLDARAGVRLVADADADPPEARLADDHPQRRLFRILRRQLQRGHRVGEVGSVLQQLLELDELRPLVAVARTERVETLDGIGVETRQ